MKTRSQLFFYAALACFLLTICAMVMAVGYSSESGANPLIAACCWGSCPLMLAILLQLFAWRNAAGERVERRHQELLERARNGRN